MSSGNKDRSSRYIGVGWNGGLSKWEVRVPFMGETICLGEYEDEDEAARDFIKVHNAAVQYEDFQRLVRANPDLEGLLLGDRGR